MQEQMSEDRYIHQAEEILKGDDATDIIKKHLARKAKQKEYQARKKEDIRTYARGYYANNKHLWNKNSQQVQCEICLKTIAASHRIKHNESKYHKTRAGLM